MSKHEYLNLVTSSLYLSSTYLLIIAGVVIVLNEILGIAGAWLESKKILIIVIEKKFSIFFFYILKNLVDYNFFKKKVHITLVACIFNGDWCCYSGIRLSSSCKTFDA